MCKSTWLFKCIYLFFQTNLNSAKLLLLIFFLFSYDNSNKFKKKNWSTCLALIETYITTRVTRFPHLLRRRYDRKKKNHTLQYITIHKQYYACM